MSSAGGPTFAQPNAHKQNGWQNSELIFHVSQSKVPKLFFRLFCDMNFKGLFQISWVCPLYVSINVKPEGGPRAYVRNLTSSASHTLRNLTKNLGPRVGTFAFYVQRNRTKSHHPMCSSVWSAAIKALKDSCVFVEVSTCFYIYTKTQLPTTHFQY